MAEKKKVQLIARQAIWTGKERVEAGKPLPDYLTDEQRKHLVDSGAAGAVEEDKGA